MAEVKPVPIANPAPLGLSGFALTTFVLSLVNAGILGGKGDNLVVIGLAVFYGGIAQFAAGMWEFRTGNTFGATAFTSYGAFWLSFAALFIPGFGVAAGSATGPTNSAIGAYLLGWTVITGLLMLGSFRINGALAAVFVLLFVTFLFLTIGALANSSGWTHLGGWLGILTAIVAWYTALAGILSHVSGGRMVLPVYPLA
ncbi:MAG TPA: acetate uptake transporter [Ktedonobacterales bacterium]|nr:acetate uptake transporter [Ktedonobacterales bacterium]